MKGVILAAGYATRFLPASKTIPKEMFPLIDRPAIDFIVQEMVDSGIQDILLVSSRRKKVMEDYFDREVELTSAFSRSNEFEKLEVIKPIEANIFTLRQQHMMGTGNALMLVEPFVDKEPFVVAYPDDIVLGEKPLSKQLIETWEKTGNTVLSVQELEEDQLWRYGVIDPDGDGNIMNVKKMVEKPEHGTAPSRFVSFGRYLYTPELFDALRTSDKSHSSKSEFTQTEAINHMAALGKVSAVKFEGTRYDLGEPLGFLTSAMQIGLQRSEFKDTLLDEMRRLLELHDNPSDGNSD
ncbi:MAG: UTP--glucose-1-phosphate uridylyltransferase [SAR324 cluster bacterium]|jgi:UTP--glucose-1-phosphate uridylyltransferase|nr:UTP--glucose-1-phosphate uridylyltransferase [SAR324 cluster bacterium]MEC7886528.1 UTP--glucose-1-phosphate uridylyltransferase [SAR324 cluster bacterium]MED5403518.1 UTP--glucose-1-phosphate uridylyltransferase [SAR324 cluster bacterium]MED5435245.1 UTP--glucose-1-phosphate uridylyltransferase [SAR324 cluster bacterium]